MRSMKYMYIPDIFFSLFFSRLANVLSLLLSSFLKKSAGSISARASAAEGRSFFFVWAPDVFSSFSSLLSFLFPIYTGLTLKIKLDI